MAQDDFKSEHLEEIKRKIILSIEEFHPSTAPPPPLAAGKEVDIKKEIESINSSLDKMNEHTFFTYQEQIYLSVKTIQRLLSPSSPPTSKHGRVDLDGYTGSGICSKKSFTRKRINHTAIQGIKITTQNR